MASISPADAVAGTDSIRRPFREVTATVGSRRTSLLRGKCPVVGRR
jgi:hypothetical protein